jgi:hypothetical protein
MVEKARYGDETLAFKKKLKPLYFLRGLLSSEATHTEHLPIHFF